MAIRWTLLAGLLAAGPVGGAVPRNADVASRLIGTWQMTKGIVGGQPLPADTVNRLRLELTAGEYTVTGAESPDRGTWRLVGARKPLGIDVTGTDGPNKGKTFPAVLDVRGDRLKVCYDLSGKQRPARFESRKKTLLFLAEYRRVKP